MVQQAAVERWKVGKYVTSGTTAFERVGSELVKRRGAERDSDEAVVERECL